MYDCLLRYRVELSHTDRKMLPVISVYQSVLPQVFFGGARCQHPCILSCFVVHTMDHDDRNPSLESFMSDPSNRRFLILGLILSVIVIAAVSFTFPRSTPAEPSGSDPGAAAIDKPAASISATPAPLIVTRNTPTIMTEDDRPSRLKTMTSSWGTNWNKHSVRYEEILAGGPPRDGIPSIDEPKFITPDQAAEWLADNEPVIALEINGDARAYPLQILIWHEIVNDTVGDVPVIVTFCPLCNSAITFDRRVQGQLFEFGTSGLLRNSDLVMYDRTTETLWQQFTGEGIVGDLTGEMLTWLPSSIISFADFRAAYPKGIVLSRETGYNRRYGSNPYVGYDNVDQRPFLFDSIPDERLRPMERVVTVSLGDTHVAYPLPVLAEMGVIHDTVNGQNLVVFHVSGTTSALDARTIAAAKDVGATGVFDPEIDGQQLTFSRQGDVFVDEQTGSSWNIVGQAIAGPLAGKQLRPIIHADHFWFSWAAFRPETIIYSP